MAKDGQAQDISQMTDDEIQDYLKQRKAQQAKLAAEKGVQAKKELEAYCLKKYGLSLQAIYTATGKVLEPKTYKDPNEPNSKPYTYSGKGKVPRWLWISEKDHKPNPAFEVKAN